MLRIRLQRTGNKNNPAYRLVVTEKSQAAKRKGAEILGHYLPTRNPAEFVFQKDRVEHWIQHGAVPTDTVARLLAKEGLKGMEKYMERYTKQKKKNAPEEEEAPAAPPAAEEAPAEAPAEEAAAPAEAPAEEPKEEVKEEPAEEKKEEAPAEEAPKEEAPEESGDKKEGDA